MGPKEFTKKTGGRLWLGVLFVGLIIVGALAWWLFSKYNEYLPYVSHDHAAWGSFGSLLSAFITLGGFVITIATLLFLNSQSQDQKSFIDWQKKTQGFDWYIKHRQLFMERLRELQTTFGEQIRFRNPEKLYEGIFPDNYLEMAGFATGSHRSESAGKLLDILSQKLHVLDVELQKDAWTRREVQEFVVELIDTSHMMQVDWIGDDCDGDLMWNGRNTGINIYSIPDSTARLHTVFDSLSYHAGRPEFVGFSRSPLRYFREALIDFANFHRGGTLDVVRVLPYMNLLASLLRSTAGVRDETNAQLMPRTFNAILQALNSRADVVKMSDGLVAGNIYDIGYVEAVLALERTDIDEENRATLLICIEDLQNLEMALIYHNRAT